MDLEIESNLNKSLDEISRSSVKEIIGETEESEAIRDDAGERRELLIAGASRPKQVAGSIARTARDSQAPILSAVGSASVNQAVKGIAIARTFLKEDKIELSFEVARMQKNEIKDLIQLTIIKESIENKDTEEVEYQELKSKGTPNTKLSALAGAIAKNVRENKVPRITAIGPKPVFKAVCAIFQARRFLLEDKLDLVVYPNFTEVVFETGTKTNAIQLVVKGRQK
mmetsp:Transcript_11681/g.13429  ORF Transcript_11681/g.13429 Transcript_11681/m.13429 type:complete len:226 (-) Transcript_11681:91-768(-)